MATKKILIVLPVIFLAAWAGAQTCPICTSCHDACVRYAGCPESPGVNCGGFTCGVAGSASQSYLDSAHPGLFTRIENAALVVTGVIPSSPADEAGIAVGDRIVVLNGEDPVLSCSAHSWPSRGDPSSADLILAHGAARRRIRLGLVPVRQLLASGWLSQGTPAPASLQSRPEFDDEPWVLGLKWESRSDSLEITDVLLGSPAYKAGLAVGDRIMDVNGIAIPHADVGLLRVLLPSDHPTDTWLTVSRGRSESRVRLASEGVSQALHDLAGPLRREPSKLELTTRIF